MVLDFSWDELLFGEQLIEQGLNVYQSSFLCFSIRDSKYIKSSLGAEYDDRNKYRNHDWRSFKKSCEALSAQGLSIVRIGQIMKTLPESSFCIDFTNQGYDEYVDLMLHRYCKFVIGTDSRVC